MLKHLPAVKEDPDTLEAIILEIMLFRPHHIFTKSCDYIGVYPDYLNLIELKGSPKYDKARGQLEATKLWAEPTFNKPVRDMKLVVYSHGDYEVHRIR